MRIVLLIVLGIALLLVLRKMQGGRQSVARRPAPPVAERMEACALCGVNQPVSECILRNGRYYCCETHRQEAEARGE